MIKNNLVAILYSNKNYEVSYKMQKWCNDNQITFVNVVDILDLSIKISQIKPTFLFIDATKNNMNIQIFELFAKELTNNNMKVICITNEIKNEIFEEINQYAICMKISDVKNYLNSNSLSLAIKKCQEENKLNIIQLTPVEDVGKFLIDIGFNPKLSGYQYLKKILEDILIKKNDILLLNQYYSAVAGIFKTNPCNIERNIRNAITRAWQSYGKDNWAKELYLNDVKRIPTNRELICYSAELINNKQLNFNI